MFTATGEKVVRELRTGTFADQLRAIDDVKHIKTVETVMGVLEKIEGLLQPRVTLLDKIHALLTLPSHAGDDRVGKILELLKADKGPKESKRHQQCKTLLIQCRDLIRKDGNKILENGKLYESTVTVLAGDIKREWINVPPIHSQQKRAALMPFDKALVRKKRKTAAPPAESKAKKQRKKREIKPQKQEARKASMEYKRKQKEQLTIKKQTF